MLRALLFAALFAAVLAVVYTKSTSAEDVIKKLDANQEKLDQLNARIQNLKNKLKARVAAREEADRKSKNMLLRLDRMDIKDGSYHCHKSTDGRQTNFKCRTGQQCVPNILVCDNKVDCEDGSDEDEDFCKPPTQKGDIWSGPQIYWKCTPFEKKDFTNLTYITTEYNKNDNVMNARMTMDLYWIDEISKLGVNYERMAPVYSHYNYATHTSVGHFYLDGIHVITKTEFDKENDLFVVRSFFDHDMSICQSAVMYKYNKEYKGLFSFGYRV